MAKTYSFRELLKLLREYDSRFEVYENRAKGSERMLYHPNINGRSESYPLKCHRESDDIRRGHLSAIKRRFHLAASIFRS